MPSKDPPRGVYDFYWKTWDQILYSLNVSGRGEQFSNKLANMVWWEANTQNKGWMLTQPYEYLNYNNFDGYMNRKDNLKCLLEVNSYTNKNSFACDYDIC
jgi:hypothetical protein